MVARPPHHTKHGYVTPGAPVLPRLRDVLRWQWEREKVRWPIRVNVTPSAPDAPSPGVGLATWINHSTYLLQWDGVSLLTDPIFSEHAGPWGRFGPRRVHAPGRALAELPDVDIVVLSHDHYDHCDLPSLEEIAARHQPVGVTLLGNGALLKRAGFTRVIELDWWQTTTLEGGLTVTATPAQHWSKRLTSPRSSRLWGGFFLATTSRRIHFVGDTGYHPTFFQEIATRLGHPDLALIPIGAYAPRWFMRPQHVDPEEAVKIHLELGSRQSLAMHWGTFQLTDEPRDEPPARLAEALQAAAVPSERFRVLEPGQTHRF